MNFKVSSNVLAFVLISPLAFAVGLPHLDIPQLISSSDAVVLAEASTPEISQTSTRLTIAGQTFLAKSYSTNLRVKAVLKGSCPDDILVSYLLPVAFVGYIPIQPGFRIVFLRHDANGYEPANPYFPDFPASRTDMPSQGESDSEVALLVYQELSAVMSSEFSSAADKFQVLQISFAIPPNDTFTASLNDAKKTVQNGRLKDDIEENLLIRGDFSGLTSVVNSLLTNTVSSDGKYDLLYAIGNRITSSKAEPSIELLLFSSDAQLRTAGAEALWHIADQKSKHVLIRGLSDPNRDVRYYSVRGLADITGQNLWGPSIPAFQDDEALYLNHWKKWAESMK